MPVEITMPQLTDTMAEGTLVKWLKLEGDKVKAGDIVAEVETDKAIMEMESADAGTLAVLGRQGGRRRSSRRSCDRRVGGEQGRRWHRREGSKYASGAKSDARADAAAARPHPPCVPVDSEGDSDGGPGPCG